MIPETPLPAPPALESGRPRKPRFSAQVTRVQALTPRMVRVTFGGAALADFAWNGPAAHIKLIFSQTPPIARTYTPRRFDPRAPELDVEFVIHGEGPASTWAAQAAVGQSLTIAGPGRSYAIPAIGTILEALPAHVRATVLLEVADLGERHAFASREAHTETHWLPRGADPARAGTALERALRELEWPSGSGRAYVACEAGAMRRLRRHLLHERGIAREHLVTRGYWKLGATDHPDRDYGEDVG